MASGQMCFALAGQVGLAIGEALGGLLGGTLCGTILFRALKQTASAGFSPDRVFPEIWDFLLPAMCWGSLCWFLF
jgi:hypothetical protein